MVRMDLDENGCQVGCTHWEYNPKGQLISEVTQVMDRGIVLREYGYHREYDKRGHLSKSSRISK